MLHDANREHPKILVGGTGFEPVTSSRHLKDLKGFSPSLSLKTIFPTEMRATRLRYPPTQNENLQRTTLATPTGLEPV